MKSLFLFLTCGLLACTLLAADPSSFEVSAFTFQRPPAWQWVEVNSPMRKAQLQVTEGKETGDIVFYHFGTSGGDVASNTQRWFKQFTGKPGAEKMKEETFGKTKVTFAATEGTFASGMPGGPTSPMENYALDAAILENPEGLVFVKFTGPAALVKANHEKFVDFIKGGAQSIK